MNVLLHPDAAERIGILARQLPQGVLLTGEGGVGLFTVAKELLSPGAAVVIAPQLITKTSSIPQISSDVIRNLYTVLRGKSTAAQVVIIDDADTMTLPAQHSFLKLLEEPPSAVRFILTSHHPERLLPTVRSRVQMLQIPRCNAAQTDELLAACNNLSDVEKKQAAFIATGLPAEIARINENASYKEKVIQAMATAKQMLEADAAKRAMYIAKLPTDRAKALFVVEKMIQIIQHRPTESSIQLLEKLMTAHMRIGANGSVRLQLAAAMV